MQMKKNEVQVKHLKSCSCSTYAGYDYSHLPSSEENNFGFLLLLLRKEKREKRKENEREVKSPIPTSEPEIQFHSGLFGFLPLILYSESRLAPLVPPQIAHHIC